MDRKRIARELEVHENVVRALIKACGYSENQPGYSESQVERMKRAYALRCEGKSYELIRLELLQENAMSQKNGNENGNGHSAIIQEASTQDKVIESLISKAQEDADAAASIYRNAFRERFIEQIGAADVIDAIEVGNGLSLASRARELGYLPPASFLENPRLESESNTEYHSPSSPLDSELVSSSASE